MIGPNPRPQIDIAEKTTPPLIRSAHSSLPIKATESRRANPNGSLFQQLAEPRSAIFRHGQTPMGEAIGPFPSPQACRKHAARDYRGATQDRRSERRPHVAPTGAREAAMKENDLQYRNARLRRKIDGALKNRPELEAVVNNIALKEPTNASPEQVQANLQERAWAIIDAEPELDGYFED
jgi:hypothetical protein